MSNAQALQAVYGSRLADSILKIAKQENAVLVAGLMARAHVAHCWQLLVQKRLERSIAFVEKYFVGHPAGDARHLATQSRGYIESVRLGDELEAYNDNGVEISHGLTRLPANWQSVRAVCAIEEGLTIEIPAGFEAETLPTSASPYLVPSIRSGRRTSNEVQLLI